MGAAEGCGFPLQGSCLEGFDTPGLHQEQRMGYIIQYELQGTAVNPWASNSTYINVTSGSDLLNGTGFKTASHQFTLRSSSG